MIRLLLRPPHFQCDTPAEAAKLARIIRISSDAPLIEVVDSDSAKTKKCVRCGKSFSTVAHADRSSSSCRDCRPPRPGWKKPRKPIERKPRVAKERAVPVRATAPASVAPRGAAFVSKHGPVSCRDCGATVPEFESINGLCLQCAPMGERKAS